MGYFLHELHEESDGKKRNATISNSFGVIGTVVRYGILNALVQWYKPDTGSASQSGRRTLWGEQFQGTVTTPHLRAHWQQNLVKWPAVIVSKRSFLTSVSPICCPNLVWSTMTPVLNGPPMQGVRKGRTWMKTVNQPITKRCGLHRRKQNNHLIAFHPANNVLLQTAMTTGTCIPTGEVFMQSTQLQ